MMESTTDRRGFVRFSAGAGVPLLLGMSHSAAAQDRDPDNQEALDFFGTVRNRRSVRSFLPNPVPEEDLLEILDAARLAPTSGNQQPWMFLVVRDRSTIQALKDACVERSLSIRRTRGMPTTEEAEQQVRASFEGYFSAPVYVVVLTDGESRYPAYNHWDGPLAAGYLMLAARALGYGTVFITDSVPEDVTREVLAIPDRYARVCITPIGVPEAWPESPEKKDLKDFIVYEGF